MKLLKVGLVLFIFSCFTLFAAEEENLSCYKGYMYVDDFADCLMSAKKVGENEYELTHVWAGPYSSLKKTAPGKKGQREYLFVMFIMKRFAGNTKIKAHIASFPVVDGVPQFITPAYKKKRWHFPIRKSGLTVQTSRGSPTHQTSIVNGETQHKFYLQIDLALDKHHVDQLAIYEEDLTEAYKLKSSFTKPYHHLLKFTYYILGQNEGYSDKYFNCENPLTCMTEADIEDQHNYWIEMKVISRKSGDDAVELIGEPLIQPKCKKGATFSCPIIPPIPQGAVHFTRYNADPEEMIGGTVPMRDLFNATLIKNNINEVRKILGLPAISGNKL